MARLREAQRREQEAAYEEAPPYVCPECHCVGPEPHAPGCDEARRELPFGGDDGDEDDGAHDPCDIECIFCGFPTFDCKCDDDYGDDEP